MVGNVAQRKHYAKNAKPPDFARTPRGPPYNGFQVIMLSKIKPILDKCDIKCIKTKRKGEGYE